jgi:hypothetical protein
MPDPDPRNVILFQVALNLVLLVLRRPAVVVVTARSQARAGARVLWWLVAVSPFRAVIPRWTTVNTLYKGNTFG